MRANLGEQNIPDISKEVKAEVSVPIDKVGMGQIEMPVSFKDKAGRPFMLNAKVNAFVNLIDPRAKGIHMSRLYLPLQQLAQPNESLNLKTLKSLLWQFIVSQESLSDSSYVTLAFELPLVRQALLSQEKGWRYYPVTIEAKQEQQQVKFYITTEVAYSSTCPCSAALARQLVAESFNQEFAAQDKVARHDIYEWLKTAKAMAATPHAQRSYAKITVDVPVEFEIFYLENLIDGIEAALGTPVQAAVKRIDEQEFARLNASNLMFCEDASRKIQSLLETQKEILDYRVEVEHQESLHPHNAVSVLVKGVHLKA